MPADLLEKPREKEESPDLATATQDTTPKVIVIFGKEVDVNNIPTPNIRGVLSECTVQTKGYGDHEDHHDYSVYEDYGDYRDSGVFEPGGD